MIPITPPRWPQIGPSLIRAPWRGVYVPGGSFSPLSLGSALAAWWRGDSGLLTGGGRQNVRANISEFRGTLATAPTSGWVSFHVYVDTHTSTARVLSLGDADNRLEVYSNGSALVLFQNSGGVTQINAVTLTGTTAGRWHHVFVRWNSSGYEAFVNGTSVQSGSGDYSVASLATTCAVFGYCGASSDTTTNYTLSARISKLAIGTTYVSGMETTLCNQGNGLLYGSLTAGQKTDWGLLNYYNCNETDGTADLIDQHGGDDLTPTFAELLADGGLELWASSSNLTHWTESLGTGASITQESSIVDAGTFSSKHVVVSDSQQAALNQSVLTSGHRYAYSVRARNGGSGNAVIFAGSTRVDLTLTTAWTTFAGTVTASAAQFWLYAAYAATVYFDQASVKAVDILPCDGPAADVASDSIGTNHGAVVVGSGDNSATKWSSDRPAALAGVVDGSFTFDGTDDRIAITGIATGTTHSFTAWSKSALNNELIFGSASAGFALYHAAGTLYYGNGSATATVSHTPDGTSWHHYAVTRNGTSVKFYYDGSQLGTTQTLGNNNTWTFNNISSYSNSATYAVTDKLADLRFYGSVELSASQVAELAAGGEATGATPAARWKLDDGPQTPVTDGDPILEFRSQDTYRWQAIQSTQANRPEYEAAGIGGRGSLVFDGSNDYLSVADDLDTSTDGCYTLAARPSALSGDHVLLSTADVAVANKYFHLGFDSTGKVYVETNLSGTTTRATGNTVCSVGNDYVITVSSDGSIIVNGVTQTLTGSNSNWPGDVSNRDNFVLGALVTSSGVSKLFNGMLGEVVLCTDNTKADQIHTYARAYWGT